VSYAECHRKPVQLRYYADDYDEERHRTTVELLRRVRAETGLAIKITRVGEKYDTDYSEFSRVERGDASEVYDRDFHRNQILSDHLGSDTPAGAFKNAKGTRAYINGTVGVVNDDHLLWATQWNGESDSEAFDISYPHDLLRFVRDRGVDGLSDRLDQLEAERTGPPVERVVRNQFASAGPLSGEVEREQPVGRTVAVSNPEIGWSQSGAENLATRNVDLVVETDDTHWVVEVKREYSAQTFDHALGQVIVSEELYRRDTGVNEAKTRRGLVFGQLQSAVAVGSKRRMFTEMLQLAERYDTTVFVGVDDGEYVRATTKNADDLPVAHWE